MKVLLGLALSLPLAFAQTSLGPCTVDTDCSTIGRASCTNGLCFCNDGYVALDQTPSFCLDVDECATGLDNCDSVNGYCVDFDPPQKFECGCLPGYVCANGACTRCAQDTTHPCFTNNGGCSSDAKCIALSGNRNQCSCNEGFTGDGVTCTSTATQGPAPTPAPTASCGTSTCDTDVSTCVTSNGVSSCVCNSGYFQLGGGNCVDINECSTPTLTNCTANRSECINSPGSFRCQCQTGFEDFPGSIRGTDCRTEAEIIAAVTFGSGITFETGFDGLTAADLVPGSPARQGLIDTFVNDYGILAEDIEFFNISDTTVTRRLEHGRALQPFSRAFLTCRLRARSETSVSVDVVRATEEIRAKFERIETLVTALSVDPETGLINAETTTITTTTALAIRTEFLSVTVTRMNNRGGRFNRERFISTRTFEITRITAVVLVEEVTTSTIVSGNDPQSPFIQQAFESGLSVAPSNQPTPEPTPEVTPSPSLTGSGARFLGEEEDFFGDSASFLNCKCIDCDPHAGCEDLWKGRSVFSEDSFPLMETHAVISVCHGTDLGWLPKFLGGTVYSSLTLISRCGKDISGVVQGAEILSDVKYENDDKAFLSWIEKNYNRATAGAVLFLNEDPANGKKITAVQLAAAVESTPFQCGSTPAMLSKSISRSAFCDEFGELVQQCESGMFATTMDAIRRRELLVWTSGATEWARLLSSELSSSEEESLRKYSTGSDANGCLTHDYGESTPSWLEVEEETIGVTVSRFLARLFQY